MRDVISSSLYPLSTPCPSSCNILFVNLSCSKREILCCLAYIPPGLCCEERHNIADFFVRELDAALVSNPDKSIIIAGDFNDFCTHFFKEDFALSEMVKSPTRLNACLDQIWIDDCLLDFFSDSDTVGPPIQTSDHNTVLLRSSKNILDDDSVVHIPVWDFRESHLADFLQYLSKQDFSSLETVLSVDEMCDIFYNILYASISVIPFEMVTLTKRDKPWITPVLKLLIQKRWQAFRTQNWALYNHYRLKVKDEIRKAKCVWADEHKQTSQGLWKIVNERRMKKDESIFSSLRHVFPDIEQLLIAFTEEFRKNYNNSPDVPLTNIKNKNWDFVISDADVFWELVHLNTRKASGPDKIPIRILVVGAEILCRPLCLIYNHSIKTHTFPKCFKNANVYPIPKKKAPSLKDFRPISITSVLGKVFERLVLKEMKKSLISLYGRNQHAYRPFGSTTSALVSLHDEVTSALDLNDTIAVRLICLDLSKAFDCLQHHRLLNFLESKGVDHGFLVWLKSYLSFRNFQVKVNNRCGPLVKCISGVPQGSVLGPFLFASFMGSVNFNNVQNIKCIKYADDVTIIEVMKSPDQVQLSSHCISTLFSDVGLFLNESKCKELIFQRSVLPKNIVSNHVFPHVSSLRVLGFIFNDSLTWNLQISDVIKRASRRLYIIRCLKSILSKKELIIVYNALITSLFLYAAPTYGNLCTTQKNKLDRFIRRAHRIICGCDCTCEQFLTINKMLMQHGLKFLRLCERNPDHPLHCYVPARLPRSNHFALPFSRTTRRRNSFFPFFCYLDNSL